jgi:hypothetical protein
MKRWQASLCFALTLLGFVSLSVINIAQLTPGEMKTATITLTLTDTT